MKIKLQRDGDYLDINMVRIYIGENRYRLTESKDHKLNINKFSDGDSDLLLIYPRTGSEIELV